MVTRRKSTQVVVIAFNDVTPGLNIFGCIPFIPYDQNHFLSIPNHVYQCLVVLFLFSCMSKQPLDELTCTLTTASVALC